MTGGIRSRRPGPLQLLAIRVEIVRAKAIVCQYYRRKTKRRSGRTSCGYAVKAGREASRLIIQCLCIVIIGLTSLLGTAATAAVRGVTDTEIVIGSITDLSGVTA